MTLEECTSLLAPLALALQKPMDGPTFRAYHRILKDVPAELANHALTEIVASGLVFMPSAPEILIASEKARRRLLAQYPYTGCAECEEQRGYRSVLGDGGQPTVEPCPCKNRWLERLGRMGVREPLALLPGEASTTEEQVYPTFDQLPAGVRQQIGTIAAQKAIK